MQRARVWVTGLATVLLLGCVPSPILWSPDGKWLAYTMAVRPTRRVLAPGWLFEVGTGPGPTGQEPAGGRPRGELRYRLWATRVADGASVLLEEGRGPLTSPGWNPDGSALAFGRLVPQEDGGARFEIVVQEAPDRRRILHATRLGGFKAEAEGLPGLAVCWSPDGRHLAVPQFEPPGLAVLRADNGRVLKTLKDAFLPSWSPDGSKLAYYGVGEPEGLYCLDAGFGAPRFLAALAQPSQPPVWAPDGQSLLAVRKATPGPGVFPPSVQAELVRVTLDPARVETVRRLEHDPMDRDQAFLGASFGMDRDGEHLFYTTNIEGQPSQITWHRLRGHFNQNRFPLLDSSMPLGALAVSPTGLTLAVRVGPPDILSPPALCDPESRELTLIAPDDAARAEWIGTLVAAARSIVRDQIPAPLAGGRPLERASLLPVPGEVASNDPAASRLRHLGRLGRPLCDRPAAAAPADAAVQALLDEARLCFDYLREDYPAALAALEAVEARTVDPDQKLGLLAVRAQILLGLGDLEQARFTIAYLDAVQPRRAGRIEMVADGLVLSPEADPGEGWTAFLAEKAESLARRPPAAAASHEVAPPGLRNPGHPEPGPLDPAEILLPPIQVPPFGIGPDVPLPLPLPPVPQPPR
jgi:Tol biopolymer transport system component